MKGLENDAFSNISQASSRRLQSIILRKQAVGFAIASTMEWSSASREEIRHTAQTIQFKGTMRKSLREIWHDLIVQVVLKKITVTWEKQGNKNDLK